MTDTDTTPTSPEEHGHDEPGHTEHQHTKNQHEENRHEENRHDQLTTAPNATEADAAPRIDVSDQGDGITRIDIRDDAAVRPGADPDEIDPDQTHPA